VTDLWIDGDADPTPDEAQRAHVDSVIAAGGRVDSALSPAEQLRRFRDAVAPNPDTLRHASPSADALVRRWAAAIAARDTTALVRMTLDVIGEDVVHRAAPSSPGCSTKSRR
jgi:hypothetical protein